MPIIKLTLPTLLPACLYYIIRNEDLCLLSGCEDGVVRIYNINEGGKNKGFGVCLESLYIKLHYD